MSHKNTQKPGRLNQMLVMGTLIICTVFLIAWGGAHLWFYFTDNSIDPDQVISETAMPKLEQFQFETYQGQTITQNYFKEHRLNLVLFWQSHCKPCERSLEALRNIAKENPEIGFLAISIDRNPEPCASITKELAVPFPCGIANAELFTEVKSFLAESPTLFFLDQDGYGVRKVINGDLGTTAETQAKIQESINALL